MLIPNNPNIDFVELNRRIEAEVRRYQQDSTRVLPTFNANPPHGYDRPYGWSALTQLDDEALVIAAFPSLLGRKAKATEAADWLRQLRSGLDRFEFLATLRYSAEGKRQGTPVQGLRRARIRSALRHTPVLGTLLANAYGWIKTDARHRYYMARFDLHSRQLEQQHKAISASEATLLAAINNAEKIIEAQQATITELQALLQQQCSNYLEQQIQLQQYQASQQSQLKQYQESQQSQLKHHAQTQQELRSRLSYLERNDPRPTSIPSATGNPAEQFTGSSIPDSFYLAFENRFRGDAETIRSRLAYYLPIIDSIKPLADRLPVVDIGCGRGEWLKMLPDTIKRIGIDFNTMNIKACHDQGLQAEVADGLAWLRQQPDNSIAAVTAFHVIEHLSFEQLHTLLDECQRVLAPGGLVIFETPNPENLVSAATHFHTDPTHIHPLPPAFSEFLLEYKGFTDVHIHRLNPIPAEYALIGDSEVARRCNTLFYGPQDYAVTALKGQP